jgi:hypothetical protein
MKTRTRTNQNDDDDNKQQQQQTTNSKQQTTNNNSHTLSSKLSVKGKKFSSLGEQAISLQ